jgi:hypothetical protein
MIRKFNWTSRARGYPDLLIAQIWLTTSLWYILNFWSIIFIAFISLIYFCSAVDLRNPGRPAIWSKYFSISPPKLPTFVDLPFVKDLPRLMTQLEITNTVGVRLESHSDLFRERY